MNPIAISPAHAATLATALATGDSGPLIATHRAAVTAAHSYRRTTAVIAAGTVEQFNDTVKGAKNSLLKLRELGIPPLTMQQAQAVVEALKLGNALVNPAEGAGDFLPLQFLEVLVDTRGFSTVAENVTAALTSGAPPIAPVWSGGFAETTGDGSLLALASELLTAQQRLAESVEAASAALVNEQDANALVVALTTPPSKAAPYCGPKGPQ